MKSLTIKLNDLISCNKGITPDEGQPVYDKLISSLKEGQKVVLDFKGVEILTTAFLNVAIGYLYKDYTSEELRELLSFESLNDTTARRIKKVTDNAKEFYKNQEEFNQMVKEVLDENN